MDHVYIQTDDFVELAKLWKQHEEMTYDQFVEDMPALGWLSKSQPNGDDFGGAWKYLKDTDYYDENGRHAGDITLETNQRAAYALRYPPRVILYCLDTEFMGDDIDDIGVLLRHVESEVIVFWADEEGWKKKNDQDT